jgi:predicted AAA+ superfamily ATPase
LAGKEIAMSKIIGRVFEQKRLAELYASHEAEFVAVYGRRRVGKTYLVTEFFKEKGLFFELAGQYGASVADQLGNFLSALDKVFSLQGKVTELRTWNQAFEMLKQQLESKGRHGHIVLFFDELPWLATRKSGFLGALEHFWNSWASRQNHCKVIVCGSAASWVIQNIINAKGGLHNRLTASIRLLPFSLNEARDFLRYRGIRLNNRQILDIYLVMGGIPHYLKQIRKGISAAQNVNNLCFRKDGLLVEEFGRLFDSLFDNSLEHKKVVTALAHAKSGLRRVELLQIIGAKPGGTLNRILANLEEAGFIMRVIPFGQINREATFRLCDEYSRFYVSWIAKIGRAVVTDPESDYWARQSTGQRWKTWAGLAFEDVCLKHTRVIKKALGIGAVITTESAWYLKGASTKEGAQIDLLIDRNDNCITVCEIKYHEAPLTLDKKDAAALRRKILLFKENTNTRKTVFLAMVTAEGIKPNENSIGLVDNEIVLADLFT